MKMTTNHGYILTDASGEPVSRTYQYRKVMKPMLERKRRARINRCLDELKELMTGALQNEGENVAKLEKADILELTVRHLHNIRRQTQLSSSCGGGQTNETTYADRFKAGFRQCAAEVTHFLGTLDEHTSVNVLKHLNGCIKKLELYQQQQQQQMQLNAPPVSPPRQQSISPHQHNQCITTTTTPSPPPPPPSSTAQPIINQPQIQHTQLSQSPPSIQHIQSIKQEINGTANRIINRTQTPPPWIRNLRSTISHHQQPAQSVQQHQSTNYQQQLNTYPYSTNSIKVRPLSTIGYSTTSTSSSSSSSTITPILNIEMLSPKIDVEDQPVWRPW